MIGFKSFIVAALIGLLPLMSWSQTITDGSFESMGTTLGNGASLPPFPGFVSGWVAVTTDGEIYNDGNAFDGDWYIDLLQNSGANQNTFWNEASFSSGGYDRLLTTISNLSPNTAYSVVFYHSTQLNRYGYLADRTLVQIQSVQTNDGSSFIFTTPSTNVWKSDTINFTTDSATTSVYLLFSPLGPNNASVSLDKVSISLAEPCSTMSLSFMVSITSPGNNIKGAMKATVTGGEPPYFYSLDSLSFQMINIFTSLDFGTYQIYVTDNSGCTTQGEFTIDESKCQCGIP